MDAAIGEVVAELENNGMMENTVIIFTSDNGGQSKVGASNYPFRGNKSYFYEGGKKTTNRYTSIVFLIGILSLHVNESKSETTACIPMAVF